MATQPLYPQTQFLDDVGRPSRVWQQYLTNIQMQLLTTQTNLTNLQNQVNALFSNTLPASALPAMPAGYVVLTINNTAVKVPFYSI